MIKELKVEHDKNLPKFKETALHILSNFTNAGSNFSAAVQDSRLDLANGNDLFASLQRVIQSFQNLDPNDDAAIALTTQYRACLANIVLAITARKAVLIKELRDGIKDDDKVNI